MPSHPPTRRSRPRTIAVGDIHGHRLALDGLLRTIQPAPGDTLIFLGDSIDRGPDSRGVLELLLALRSECQVVSLLGNHEAALLEARSRESARQFWLSDAVGGLATLASYGTGQDLELIPGDHWRFLETLPLFHETDSHFFIHANYAPNWPLDQHDTRTALWLDLANCPGPHFSGKTAIVGHTPQPHGQILDLGHLICIDTGCGFGGVLTALEVDRGKLWQVDEHGRTV
ncbi:MAG: metallophosphoesterase family protein [Planctomycetaceae bacterium]